MNRTQSKVAKAAACILICLILAGCADKPEAAPPDEPPEDTEVAEFPAEPENGYVSMTRQLLEEKLSNDRTDCHVHSVNIVESRFDPVTGDRAAAFEAECTILPPEGGEEESYETGYLLYDGETKEWSLPEWERSGPALLDYIDENLGLDPTGHHWLRFQPLPEDQDLPAELTDPSLVPEHYDFNLLAELPEKDIALYRDYGETKVYLRYGGYFQVFEQDISALDMLPEMKETRWENNFAVSICYRHHDVIDSSPCVTGETVVYSWCGEHWMDVHSGAVEVTEDETLPDPASLPVQLVTPETADTDVWLAAELPEFDIAAYYDTQQEKSWLRYGSCFQEVSDPLVDRADMVLPELHFEDFDGDEERDLAVLSGRAADGGYSNLTVYRWTGQKWQGLRRKAYSVEIDGQDYLNGIFQYYADGTAYIAYEGDNILLDLSGFQWEEEPDKGFLNGDTASYAFQDGTILRTLSGTVLPYDDTVFTYAASLSLHYFDNYLSFYSGTLHSPYEIPNEFRPEDLSEKQKQVLLRFIEACEEVISSDKSGFAALDDYSVALCDVNGDGQKELITESREKTMPEDLYGTNTFNRNGKNCGGFYPTPRFYDNGIVWVPLSHNQGPATAIWPFSLYDLASHREIGGARAWSNKVEGFPAEADLDGDGIVYYVGDDTHDMDVPIDIDVYEAWWDSYMGGARILPVYYFHLSEDILNSLGLPLENEERPESPAARKRRAALAAAENKKDSLRTDREIMLGAYTEALLEMCTHYYESNADSGFYEMLPENCFAVFDIDGDGEDELVTKYRPHTTHEQVLTICGFDSGVFVEFSNWYSAVLYNNGVIRSPAHNNQGRAVDAFWPYTVYQYHPDTNTYDPIAWTNAWDKREEDGADWDGVPFPAEADLDGDGIVYYILTDEDCPPHAAPVDGAAFEKWEKSYFSAEEIEIPWQPLTLENMRKMA